MTFSDTVTATDTTTTATTKTQRVVQVLDYNEDSDGTTDEELNAEVLISSVEQRRIASLHVVPVEELVVVEVAPNTIVEDVVRHFSQENINHNALRFRFRDEQAVGKGVARDVKGTFIEAVVVNFDGSGEKMQVAMLLYLRDWKR